jgi:hypothetical protein
VGQDLKRLAALNILCVFITAMGSSYYHLGHRHILSTHQNNTNRSKYFFVGIGREQGLWGGGIAH